MGRRQEEREGRGEGREPRDQEGRGARWNEATLAEEREAQHAGKDAKQSRVKSNIESSEGAFRLLGVQDRPRPRHHQEGSLWRRLSPSSGRSGVGQLW